MVRHNYTECTDSQGSNFSYKFISSSSSLMKITDSQIREISGIFLALFSGLIYSVCSILIKQLDYLHPGQICLYSFVGIFLLSIPDTIKSDHSIFLTRQRFIHMSLRSFFSCNFMILNIYSFHYLPASQASSIGSSVLIFVTIAAYFTLKEPCSHFDSAVVLMALAGTIFMAKFNSISASEEAIGLAMAVTAMANNTCNLLMLRLVKNSSRAVIIFHLGWFGIIELLIIMAFTGGYSWHRCGNDVWYLLLLGFLNFVAQVAKTGAIQRLFAGPFTTVRTGSEIVFSFLFHALSWNTPDPYRIFGVLLVTLSVIIICLKTYWFTLGKESNTVKKLKWILKL